MVDPISAKAVTARELSVTRVTAVTPPTTTTAPSRAPADTAALTGVAQQLSAAPPVSSDRVAQIKKAITEGKFPLVPSTVADRLIAYKLEWMKNDQA